MADKKVTELPVATQLDGSELVLVVQTAQSKQVAAKEIFRTRYQDVVSESTSTKTLALTDIGRWIRNTSAQTVTVPTNANVAFQVGTVLNGVQAGSGQVTFVGDSGVTVNKAADRVLKTRAQGCEWSLIKVGTNTWDLTGELATS